VARLVLIGSGVSAANKVTREVQAAMADLPDPVPEAFAREFQAGTAYVPLPDEFFDRIVRESLKLPARLWREIFDRLLASDDRDRLGQIRAPTLLLWGERDVLFSRKDQDGLLAGIPGSRLKIYEETGHCPNWERPDEVAADLGAFVRE
jgi:pimeloyl-ACP methyl ester carboxylesterase